MNKLRQFEAAASRKFNHGRLLQLRAVGCMFYSQIDDSCCWWWLSLVYAMKRGALFLNFAISLFYLVQAIVFNFSTVSAQKWLEMNKNYLIKAMKSLEVLLKNQEVVLSWKSWYLWKSKQKKCGIIVGWKRLENNNKRKAAKQKSWRGCFENDVWFLKFLRNSLTF